MTVQAEDLPMRTRINSSGSSISPRSGDSSSPKDFNDEAGRKPSDDPVVIATRLVARVAREVYDAATEEPVDAEVVRSLSEKALSQAEHAYRIAREHRKRNRQSFTEFATMLGEEAAEIAQEYKEEGIKRMESTKKLVEEYTDEGLKYAERTLRKARSMIEDHFQIDEAFRMLGPLAQDSNFARDVHDWFNLVALLPVIYLNLVNFSCSDPFFCGILTGRGTLASLWTGEFWEVFWWTTFAYFGVDLLFVISLPHCVRSPKVIIIHHAATILYIMVPKRLPKFAWLMGCCMTVEVNTWFLIARRTFNTLGDKPFSSGVTLGKSLRLAVISTCFYVSWFAIRMVFYPYLFTEITREWYNHWGEVGTPFNSLLPTPIIQFILICMNFKWTVDLLRSKLKGQRRGKSKGL